MFLVINKFILLSSGLEKKRERKRKTPVKVFLL